jgi:hypothetical protein
MEDNMSNEIENARRQLERAYLLKDKDDLQNSTMLSIAASLIALYDLFDVKFWKDENLKKQED